MDYIYTTSFYLQSMPCLFALALIIILWKRRHVECVNFLIIFECSTALWSVSVAFEHAATELSTKIFWSQFALAGASTIPVFFILFILSYFRYTKYLKLKFILFLIPIATLILSSTNRYHHLVWEKVELVLDNGSIYHYGKWFWFYFFYECSLGVTVIIFLFIGIIRFYHIYKRLIIYLIIASIIPLITTILYIFKLTTLNADLTPVSLIFTGIFLAVGIYMQGMFDVMPVARKQIIDNLSDGIIVLDMADRIIEANPAISAFSGFERLIGKPFNMVSNTIFQKPFDYSNPSGSTTETVIRVGEEERFFEVTFNQVTLSDQKLIGKIFIFHDISKRKLAMEFAQ